METYSQFLDLYRVYYKQRYDTSTHSLSKIIVHDDVVFQTKDIGW